MWDMDECEHYQGILDTRDALYKQYNGDKIFRECILSIADAACEFMMLDVVNYLDKVASRV